MKTYAPRPRDIERRWYVVDANDVVLGRVASQVASILKGKHKPIYAPHADTGDHVIVVNARGIRLTGGKEMKKVAYHHSGHPGGLTETRYDRLLDQRPAFVLEKAVKGMLPKNSLGRSMLRKLQVYEGADHPHGAQRPRSLAVGEVPRWDGLPAPASADARSGGKAPARRPARRPKPSASRPAAKASAAKRSTKRSTKATTKASTSKSTKASTKKTAAKKTSAKKSAAKTSAKSSAKTSASGASTSRLRRARNKKEGEDA